MPRRLASPALSLFLAALSFATSGAAQHELRPLSSGFLPTGGGGLWDYRTSPDGEWTAFVRCDQDLGGCWLASARRNAPAGDPFVEIAGPYPTISGTRLAFSADRRVIFLALSAVTLRVELWSVALDGASEPVRLHPELGGDEYLFDFALTDDGEFAVFGTTAVGAGAGRLMRAPVDGSAAATLLADGDVKRPFPYTAPGGSQFVLYLVDTDGDEQLELRKVALAGGASLPLGPGDLRADVYLAQVEIAPEAGRALLLGDFSEVDVMELVSIELDGAGPLTPLNPLLVAEGDVARFELTDDGRAVLVADAELDNKFELWSVAIDASSPPVKLSGTLANDRSVQWGFAVAGSWVVYLADAAVNDKHELWSAPIDGDASPTRRSATLPSGRDVTSFQVAPNGTRVVYGADIEVLGRTDLHRATVFGINSHQQLTNLDGGYPAPYFVREFQVSPDSNAVAFNIWAQGGWNATLFEQRLFDPLPFHEILAVCAGTPPLVQQLRYLPDAAGVTFTTALENGERTEVYLSDRRIFGDGFESGSLSSWP